MAIDASWRKIFADLDIASHDFDSSPFSLTSRQIKTACQNFKRLGKKNLAYFANMTPVKTVRLYSKKEVFLYYQRKTKSIILSKEKDMSIFQT